MAAQEQAELDALVATTLERAKGKLLAVLVAALTEEDY